MATNRRVWGLGFFSFREEGNEQSADPDGREGFAVFANDIAGGTEEPKARHTST